MNYQYACAKQSVWIQRFSRLTNLIFHGDWQPILAAKKEAPVTRGFLKDVA
jgi:hypothetical protein